MRTVLLVMRADLVARSAINQAADPPSFKPVRCLLPLASLMQICVENLHESLRIVHLLR